MHYPMVKILHILGAPIEKREHIENTIKLPTDKIPNSAHKLIAVLI